MCVVAASSVAAAQSLLSNLSGVTDGAYTGAPDAADQVRTGAATLTVSGVRVAWARVGVAPGVNRVAFYEDESGRPGATRIGSFFDNAAPTSVGVMTYSGAATLAPNKTYWLVLLIADQSELAYTNQSVIIANETTYGATLPAGSAYGNAASGTWDTSDPADLKFELIGSANGGQPTPVPQLPIWGSGLLLASILSAAWRYGRARGWASNA